MYLLAQSTSATTSTTQAMYICQIEETMSSDIIGFQVFLFRHTSLKINICRIIYLLTRVTLEIAHLVSGDTQG